jgi:SepF-like predicted cell division protein (DUF552 family)
VIKMMDGLKTMFKGADEHDYAEMVMEESEARSIPIVVDRIESFTCSDRVSKYVREGKIVFARVGEFKNLNVDEFKRTVSKIRNVCTAIDGDIVGVGDSWLIVAPSLAKIERGN